MTSLYRKWRSRSFDDLMGQEHVVRTLRNAVRNQRIAHAYLFTGPRGTGKTSAARILAKAVNCVNPRDGNPCGVCDSCLAAQEGRALDVIEIDAASNTGVDNVRDLRERVAYAAAEGRYKVYIVDEVHRLSGGAFDAFLKTLEEPPPHVIFVFASTEPHKVPATIASRCQRLDFHRIAPATSLARLQEVALGEGLIVSGAALNLIVQQAQGSLRDAVGLLDQASAYTSGDINEGDIRQSLGLADPGLVVRLSDALLVGDVGSGLDEAARFIAAGGEPQQLLNQLIGYWRALLLAVSGANISAFTIDPGLHADLERHRGQLDEHRVLAVLQALTEREFSAKYDLVASLPLEVALVQASLSLSGNDRPAAEKEYPLPPPPAPVPARQAEQVKPNVPRSTPSTPTVGLAAPEARRPEAPALPGANGHQAESSTGAPPPTSQGGDVETWWPEIVSRMRDRSKMLQAVLRSGYLLRVEQGEVTVGFEHDFHRTQLSDVKRRRLLEEIIVEVVGSAYRVNCVRTTKEEVVALRGAQAVQEDDGFIDEAAEQFRQYHVRQMQNGNS